MDIAMDIAMDIDPVPLNKICRTCHTNLIPNYQHYKNCSVCREKKRVKLARIAERRREQNKYAEAHKQIPMVSIINDDSNPRLPTSISSGSKSSTKFPSEALKPIPPKLLHELGGKEKKDAIRDMKASLKGKIRVNGGTKLIVGQMANVPENSIEFQTASSLYEKLKTKALRASAAGKRLRFNGCHSIVAISAINNEHRVEIVTNDLRKIARISFSRCSAIERVTDGSRCSMVYDCKCLCSANENTRGLSNQEQAVKDVVCKGTVRVTAELDISHPHGLEGQKISVHIYH